VYDHVVGAEHADREPPLWGPYTDKDPFHDPFVMFGYLAAVTSRIELVTGVLILPQRQTVLVAQQAADADLLSGGRLRLGVGTGWNYVEYHALGQDFSSRGARLDEQIGFLRRLWSEPLVTFEGRFDRIERGNINPRPARSIPIWVGGFSPPAFRRGARLGDGFIFAGDLDRNLGAMSQMRQDLARSGRDADDFGYEFVQTRSGTPDGVAATSEQWAEAGGTHMSVVSMKLGLQTAADHLEYLHAVKERLDARLGGRA
jgi:probable F420-dependent oxidoreductase